MELDRETCEFVHLSGDARSKVDDDEEDSDDDDEDQLNDIDKAVAQFKETIAASRGKYQLKTLKVVVVENIQHHHYHAT